MPQVQLNDQVYDAARRRATDGRYPSVDEYVADIVAREVVEENENFDSVFTAERLAELHRLSSEIKAGGTTHSMDEVQKHFERKRSEWQANHPT